MKKRFIAEEERVNLKQIISKYVEDPIVLKPVQLNILEEFDGRKSEVICDYEINGVKKNIKFSSDCVIGSIFDALVLEHSVKFSSLKTLGFVGYSVNPIFSPASKTNSDAPVEVKIEISSSNKSAIPFREKDVSVLKASTKCIFGCIQYYINSERCFRKLKMLIKEAQSRARGDIAQQYISDISEIVKVTGYSDV